MQPISHYQSSMQRGRKFIFVHMISTNWMSILTPWEMIAYSQMVSCLLLDPNPEMEPEGQVLVDSFAIKFLKHNQQHYSDLVASSKKVFGTKISAYIGDKKSSRKFQTLCLPADAEGLNDQFIAHGLAPAVATNTKDIKTNMKDIAPT